MKTRMSVLLAATALAGFGLGSTAAMAFDEVDWEWNKLVDEQVIKRVNITTELVPTGMVELEKLQVQIGNVSAESSVSDVHNNPPAGGGGPTSFDETVLLETNWDETPPAPFAIIPVSATSNGITVEILPSDTLGIDENNAAISQEIRVSGTVDVVPTDAFDAVDLPSVESAATAVGNNQQINTDASVQLHDAQFTYNAGGEFGMEDLMLAAVASEFLNGGFPNGPNGPDVDTGETQVQGGDNLHTDLAIAASMGAILGILTPANISATSTVFDIDNATVDSSATAVSNNIGVDVAAATPGDALVLGDITQFSYANVSAASSVSDVVISNYANMGVIDRPIVSSTATAVGNNVTVNVARVAP